MSKLRIFFSHSSRDKPLLREIQQYLPQYIKTWIDEHELLAGVNLNSKIREAIYANTDFVVIFIGPEAVKSTWVRRELNWALKKEKEIGRVFVIPVLLDNTSWKTLPVSFQDRMYLSCTDFTLEGVKHFSKKLGETVFAWVSDPSFDHNYLEDEEVSHRCELVRELAMKIADKPRKSDDKLTVERLKYIIGLMEMERRIELLTLYEMRYGKFREQIKSENLENPRYLEILCEGPKSNIWTHTMYWFTNPFSKLQKDYGLGNDEYEVREVFLRAINSLTQKQKSDIFIGFKVLRITFLR